MKIHYPTEQEVKLKAKLAWLTKRLNSSESISNPERTTLSFREKQNFTREKLNRIKFLSALKKISRFRD